MFPGEHGQQQRVDALPHGHHMAVVDRDEGIQGVLYSELSQHSAHEGEVIHTLDIHNLRGSGAGAFMCSS
jgi:hypothetical protein